MVIFLAKGRNRNGESRGVVKAEIKVPAVGESISEAVIGEWSKKSGEFVKRDDVILLLETDKASVEVVAPNDGVLTTTAKAGETVKIGAVVAFIDTEGVATAGQPTPLEPLRLRNCKPLRSKLQLGQAARLGQAQNFSRI